MKKTVKPQLPTGFKAISGGGDSWHPDKVGDSVMGVMASVKVVTQAAKGRAPARDVNLYTIQTKDGDINVWQSAGLAPLAKIKKGKPVFIRYEGLAKAEKGKNPMRLFTVATK